MITTDALPKTQPELGATLGGRYRLDEPLDPGGKRRVFAARDLVLGKEVAVKLLGPSDVSGALDWLEEGRALARLSHPNVAEVYDVAESDGLRYVVMELVPGQTLAAIVGSSGPLEPLESVRIAVQVAEGLSAVHKLGIVHCDVKPANVVVTPAGSAKLVDFGTARPKGRDEADRVVGSAPYIAPERLTRRDVDGRADVYSLGASLYELLTGRPPFLGLDDDETIQKALSEEVASPALLNRDVPDDLAATTMKALARDPELRYPTALAMASALRTVGASLRASSGAVTADFARSEPTIAMPVLASTRRSPLRKRTLVAGAIAAVLLAFGLWGIAGGTPLGASPVSASARATAIPSPAAPSLSAMGSAPLIPGATATPAPTADVPAALDPTATPSPTPDPTQAPTSTPVQDIRQVLTVARGTTAASSSSRSRPPAKSAPTKSRKGRGKS